MGHIKQCRKKLLVKKPEDKKPLWGHMPGLGDNIHMPGLGDNIQSDLKYKWEYGLDSSDSG
jgi:hypothetical protein